MTSQLGWHLIPHQWPALPRICIYKRKRNNNTKKNHGVTYSKPMNQENIYSGKPNLFLKKWKPTQEGRASKHTNSILDSTPKLASLWMHLFPSLKIWETSKFKILHIARQHFHLPQIDQGTIEGFWNASTTTENHFPT